MSVILDDDIRMFLFDSSHNDAQHVWTANTGHILQANLLCSAFNQLLREVDVIFRRVHFGIGDTHRCLSGHAGLFRPFDGGNDIARIIQTTENTGDIGSLRVLHFVHQLAHICRNRIHTQRIQTTVQHMRFDTRLVERFAERTHRLIRVLAIQQVHLLTRAAVRLYAVETTHVNDHRCYTR